MFPRDVIRQVLASCVVINCPSYYPPCPHLFEHKLMPSHEHTPSVIHTEHFMCPQANSLSLSPYPSLSLSLSLFFSLSSLCLCFSLSLLLSSLFLYPSLLTSPSLFFSLPILCLW